nr:succinate dehydrogenase, cytochrome b556 subunit [Perlucidibaca aquatica]
MPSVKSNRPVNLSLATVIELNLKSPVAIASILHRLSGVLLFFVIPGLLWLLDCSLSSAEGFACVQAMLTGTVGKLVLFVALAGLAYHFIAGVKHLVMDWGVGETLEGGRTFAKISLVVSALVIAALFVGVVL